MLLSPKTAGILAVFFILLGVVLLTWKGDPAAAPEEPAAAEEMSSVCIEGVKHWIYSTFRDRAILPAYKAQSTPELILCETEEIAKKSQYGDEF